MSPSTHFLQRQLPGVAEVIENIEVKVRDLQQTGTSSGNYKTQLIASSKVSTFHPKVDGHPKQDSPRYGVVSYVPLNLVVDDQLTRSRESERGGRGVRAYIGRKTSSRSQKEEEE